MDVRPGRGGTGGVGARAGPLVRKHRGSLAAARAASGSGPNATRPGSPVRTRCELGQPASAAAVGVARRGPGGGAHRQSVELGGQPGGGPVGACQCRTCRQPAGGAGRGAAVYSRAAVLVRALPAGHANGARAHGQRSPSVSRRPAGERRTARRRAPARRTRRRMRRRSALPRGGSRAPEEANGGAAPCAGDADRRGGASAGGDRRPDDRD